MAGVAGVVDYTTARNKTGQLQNSLDAAALAIATGYLVGMSNEDLGLIRQDSFNANMVGIEAGAIGRLLFGLMTLVLGGLALSLFLLSHSLIGREENAPAQQEVSSDQN